MTLPCPSWFWVHDAPAEVREASSGRLGSCLGCSCPSDPEGDEISSSMCDRVCMRAFAVRASRTESSFLAMVYMSSNVTRAHGL
jgi:hypothetical protein